MTPIRRRYPCVIRTCGVVESTIQPVLAWFSPAAGASGAPAWGTVAAMVTTALRPFGHIAAWLVWHSMRVSLLGDLERPQPPAD
jgi:hypothetical protein